MHTSSTVEQRAQFSKHIR